MRKAQDIAATRAFGGSVDFGKTASDYSTWRAGFPPAFFEALAERGYIFSGQHALDIGTGTGTVARGLAERGLSVTGVDPAVELLKEAAALDAKAGVSISYRQGSAEALPMGDESFDIVTAGQCWHWFDRPKAAAEAARVLRPGGRIVIAHFDWLPLTGNMVEATEALILAFNPQWTMADGDGIYPAWLRDLAEGSFHELETFSFDLSVPYTHEAWRGRIRASAGVKGSMSTGKIKSFDAVLAQILEERFPDDPMQVPHRVWAVTGLRG